MTFLLGRAACITTPVPRCVPDFQINSPEMRNRRGGRYWLIDPLELALTYTCEILPVTDNKPVFTPGGTLDPTDWTSLRAQGHRMLDDILDYIERIRERPVWQPIPDDVRDRFRAAPPKSPSDLAAVHDEFMHHVLPFATGNVHPGFMGWVHGGGTAAGMLAEMLAAGLNANLGGRDHAPVEVERQIAHRMRQIFDFPSTATGLFVTGTSMANLIGVLVARTAALGVSVHRNGLSGGDGCARHACP